MMTNNITSISGHQDSTVSNMTSKTNSKQLSFFHSVDDSDENSNSSNSVNITKAKPNTDRKGDNGVNFTEESSISKATKPSVHKVANLVESDDHDDASSTSSCSCEDHSSVADNSDEDPHGDLDYDEGSIAGSPTNNDKDSADDQLNFETSKPTSPIDDQNLVTDRNKPISNPSSDIGKSVTVTSAAIQDEQNDSTPSPGSHKEEKMGTRIKSFIDFQREDDRKSNVHAKNSSKDRSHKSYAGLLKYFFKDACYFQIKSINHENVELSKRMGVWSTPIHNEVKFNAAFREHRNVILIFSVQQSGSFQGFARITSEASLTNVPVPWVIPERLSRTALGGVFNIEWLCTKELPFPECRDIYNPLNNNKPVKVARDGQQVESKIGKKLCSLFPKDSKPRLLAALETLKRQTRHKKQSSNSRSIYQQQPDELRLGHHQQTFLMPHPMLNGYNGSLAPDFGHFAHDQFYQTSHQSLHHAAGYRGPISRRRAPNHPEPIESSYPLHDQFPSQRRGNMRHIDVLPVANYHNYHQHHSQLPQFYPYNDTDPPVSYVASHYANPMQFNDWMPVAARLNSNRFQPYQRSRR